MHDDDASSSQTLPAQACLRRGGSARNLLAGKGSPALVSAARRDWESLFTSKSRKTPLLFHLLVWTANNWKMASLENQKVEKVGQELAHSARASFVSVVIHRRLIIVRLITTTNVV
jgi:hypothetical protein